MGWTVFRGRWTRCDDWGRPIPGAATYDKLAPLPRTVTFSDQRDREDDDLDARVDAVRAALRGDVDEDTKRRIAEARKALRPTRNAPDIARPARIGGRGAGSR